MEGRDGAAMRPGACDDPNVDTRRLIAEEQDMAEYVMDPRFTRSHDRCPQRAVASRGRLPGSGGGAVRHRSG